MVVTGTHDPYLVVLSILIASFASYTALDFSGHAGLARGFARRVWLLAAAITMGGGIWSMHFVAMLAFSMPIPMSYDIGLTILSLVVAIFVTGGGFYVIGRQSASMLRLVLSGILASVYDGDDAPLRAVVENVNAYEFVRGSAAVNCYECLLVAGKVTRETIEAYAIELLGSKLERDPSNAWDSWTSMCADLGFASTVPLIQKANEDELCDPWYYGIEKLLKRAANGGKDNWKLRTELIDDTIKLTSSWAIWKKPVKAKPPVVPPKMVEARQTPKVGRNDPCPCGSGKKYKKCCVSSQH